MLEHLFGFRFEELVHVKCDIEEREQGHSEVQEDVQGGLCSEPGSTHRQLLVHAYGYRDLVQDAQKSHQLVPLQVPIAQRYLDGCAHAVGLHLPEQPALLALHAVQNARDVVNVLLVGANVVRV